MKPVFLGDKSAAEVSDAGKLVREPVVSVLMITYNQEQFIGRAIEGVVDQQTAFPYELIVGEDCSKDRTREIALGYQKRYPEKIRVITGEQNVGVKRNLFRCLNAARGKYIAYCEGDDFWHNLRKLQKQIEFLEKNLDYGLVHGGHNTFYVRRKYLVKDAYEPKCTFDDSAAFREMVVNQRQILTATVVCRKDLLVRVIEENAECRDDYWPMEDTQAWLEIARLSKVKYLPESLATYNIHESVSQSGNPMKVYKFRVMARELILHYVAKYNLGPEIEQEASAVTATALMAEAYHAREWQTVQTLLGVAQRGSRRIPIQNWLYYYGSKNELLFRMAKGGLLGMRAVHRVRRMLRHLMRASA